MSTFICGTPVPQHRLRDVVAIIAVVGLRNSPVRKSSRWVFKCQCSVRPVDRRVPRTAACRLLRQEHETHGRAWRRRSTESTAAGGVAVALPPKAAQATLTAAERADISPLSKIHLPAKQPPPSRRRDHASSSTESTPCCSCRYRPKKVPDSCSIRWNK